MAEHDDPGIGQDAKPDDTAAKVVSDTARPVRPGGGGLGGASAAADPLDQSGRSISGATPNSPIDTQAPHPEGPADVAGHEAALRAAGDAPEDKPGSR
ncbi:hypothetical protein [Sphingomonas solaris]|uniref:Uncharacterized protein n=1 Tax=Alterirhizorhabdus solaris TaxID=2529389 RepID=A0A558QTH5_9SPHN|nr:hypothetical protein [Sphingomonas solaris]TVV70429.1 hypothetical protein FOY91_19145 [Sphingomonas solaris]